MNACSRLMIGCALLGTFCAGQAAWIHAKARLAQWLIAAAWLREQSGAQDARPWPWADTHPIARLTIGKSGTPLYVLENASGQSLAFGPAHDSSSATPGEPGNSVIAGHRDTHFAILRDIAVGADIVAENRRKVIRHFRVSAVRIVDSRNTRIALGGELPRLTLVTCYPFDALRPGGPLRLIVNAELVTR